LAPCTEAVLEVGEGGQEGVILPELVEPVLADHSQHLDGILARCHPGVLVDPHEQGDGVEIPGQPEVARQRFQVGKGSIEPGFYGMR